MKTFRTLLYTHLKPFADDTSLHGFKEFYYAKRLLWKIVWLLFVTLALGITTFQVSNSVSQFISQPSTTLIQPAKAKQILYPPLRVCSSNWIYWIDWKVAYEMGFSKSTILYGMSFFHSTFTSTYFNVQEADFSFRSLMAANNFTKISDFYKSIVKRFPTVDTNGNLMDENDEKSMFSEIDIDFVLKAEEGIVLCYTLNESVLENYLSRNKSISYQNQDPTILFDIQDQTYSLLSEHLTEEEYAGYVLDWLRRSTNYIYSDDDILTKNFTTVSLPMLLYINGYDQNSIDVVFTNDWYIVSVAASAYVWKNTEQQPCQEGSRQIRQNNKAASMCNAQTLRRTCDTCMELHPAIMSKNDTVENVCRCDISFIIGNRSEKPVETLAAANFSACEPTEQEIENYLSCMASIIQPCEVWSYTVTARATRIDDVRNIIPKYATSIYIDYPKPNQIFITTEQDQQTFENFVGSVGGLLGIWTGASMLSFIQMIYLCCFSVDYNNDNDTIDKISNVTNIKRKKSIVKLARY